MWTLALLATLTFSDSPGQRAAKWQKEIDAIEKRLKEEPPKPGVIVFAGSSTFRLWDTKKAFADLNTVNVAFGGSEIRDTTHFAETILLSLPASRVVLYAGDNDINSKRTPVQVRDDFADLVKKLHAKNDKLKIDFVAIKPSPARWALYEQQTEANKLVREFIAKDPRLSYIDIVPVLLGENSEPKAEYYVKDKLHLSPAGYAPCEPLIRKALKMLP
ncbi:MAG: GDSL-type esterase/lipase family protein [Fimbriiglobus sp.]